MKPNAPKFVDETGAMVALATILTMGKRLEQG